MTINYNNVGWDQYFVIDKKNKKIKNYETKPFLASIALHKIFKSHLKPIIHFIMRSSLETDDESQGGET